MTLKIEPLEDDMTIKEMAMWDTKANILEGYRLMGCEISKSYTKDVLTTILEDVFEHQFNIIADAIPQVELPIISELMQSPCDRYVEVKRDDFHHLTIQKLHLVVTYVGPDTWHIYMPDSIRDRFNRFFDQSIAARPELQEFNRLIEQANSLREEIDKFLFVSVYLPGAFLGRPVSSSTMTAKGFLKNNRSKVKDYAKKLRELKQGFKSVEPRIHDLPTGAMQNIYDDLDRYIREVDKL